jgi:hypothetical protein
MNSNIIQEHIRRILKEETNFMRLVLRRVSPKRLEIEFKDSLDFISKMFLTNYKANSRKLSEYEFTRMVIIDFIDGIELKRYLPNDVEWYDKILNGLMEQYKDRISSMYNVLKK